MVAPIKVVVLGSGQMGSGIIKLLRQKHGIELAGVYGRRSQRAGIDVGAALGLETVIGVRITNDLTGLIKSTQPHIAIQTTSSTVAQAVDEITTLVSCGVNVISIAEEMAYPVCQSPSAAETIHNLALEHWATSGRCWQNGGRLMPERASAQT